MKRPLQAYEWIWIIFAALMVPLIGLMIWANQRPVSGVHGVSGFQVPDGGVVSGAEVEWPRDIAEFEWPREWSRTSGYYLAHRGAVCTVGPLSEQTAIALRPGYTVYVAERLGNTIKVYTAGGNLMTMRAWEVECPSPADRKPFGHR